MFCLAAFFCLSQDVVVEMNDGVRTIGGVRVEVRNRGVEGAGRPDPKPDQRFVSDEDLDSAPLCNSWS